MVASPVSGIDFRVLGPVEVVVDGVLVRVPPGSQRALLGMLLLGHGHPVSIARLTDGLWGEDQPHDPRASLHTAVARLRRTLDGTGVAVRTVVPGYALELPEGALDADRFTALHARARELLGDPAAPEPVRSRALEAAQLLESALDLWNGPAWGEFSEGFASGDAFRLEEARVAAREDLAAALMQAGRTAEAVATLQAVVGEYPLRDRAVGLLVDALHHHGRTADALAAFDTYRIRLADDLGLDPPPTLAALHQRVLRQELPVQRAVTSSDGTASAGGATSGSAAAGGAAASAVAGTAAAQSAAGTAEPPRSASGPADHLVDVPHDRLIGRDDEESALARLLDKPGLVTLVGPGGIGKSRLALQVARNDGPFFWVDLVPVRDRAGVLNAVADALHVETRSGEALEGALNSMLSTAPGLVVLDNCEHVLDEVAEALSVLTTPASRLLATSRERLGARGERVFVLEPLGLPGTDAFDERAPAVELFLERARDAGADLGDDQDVVRRVGEVCRSLDGLPLALELGAARMGTLTLDDLAERLDRRFDLLTRGPRGSPRRHRTLRSVFDWSYDLLDPDERSVFNRLSVFPTGFDLAAAEAVVGDDTLPPARVADVVATLADRSMVVRPRGSGRGKYRLLGTLRQYALSRLASVELAGLRRRHALWVVGLAEEARVGLEGAEEARWSQLLDDVLEDLRAAWRWSLEAEDLQTSRRLVYATWRWAHWRMRGDVLGWADRLLAVDPGEVDVVTLAAAIGHAWHEGRFEDAARLADLAPDGDDEGPGHADLLELLADLALSRSGVRPALELYRRAEHIRAEHHQPVPESLACSSRVLALAYAGRPLADDLERTLGLAAATGNPTAMAFAKYAEGEACAEEDVPRALGALDEALAIADEVGNRLVSGVARTAQVALLGRSSAVDDSTFELFARVILNWSASRNPGLLVTALRNLVVLLARVGRSEDAVELWAAVDGVETNPASYGPEAERIDAALDSARASLGPRYDEAADRGRARRGLAEVASLGLRLCEEGAAGVAVRSGRSDEPGQSDHSHSGHSHSGHSHPGHSGHD